MMSLAIFPDLQKLRFKRCPFILILFLAHLSCFVSIIEGSYLYQ